MCGVEFSARYARLSEVHTLHPRHTFFTNEHGVKSRSRLSRKIPATSWGRRRGPASHFGVLEVQLLRECVLGCGAAKASKFCEGNRNHSIYFTLRSGRSCLCFFQLFFLFFSRIYSLLGIGPPMPIPQRCYWNRHILFQKVFELLFVPVWSGFVGIAHTEFVNTSLTWCTFFVY